MQTMLISPHRKIGHFLLFMIYAYLNNTTFQTLNKKNKYYCQISTELTALLLQNMGIEILNQSEESVASFRRWT